MKYFIAFTLFAVASATINKPTVATGQLAQLGEVIAAILSPSTDPATAVALEQLLFQTLGVASSPQPISTLPAIVDFPLTESALAPVETPASLPEPAVVVPAAESAPLVQIIVNINQADADSVAASPAPVIVAPAPEPVPVVVAPAPEPVIVAPAPEPIVVAPAPAPVIVAPEVIAVVPAPAPITIPETVSVVEAPAAAGPY